ncbi:MAG: cation diffusion facilitator family transporter [Deltaproteobacteria bacterium]|nr:cation diffusion facilitator family transporter [Deltaproteobacteria bacterium]
MDAQTRKVRVAVLSVISNITLVVLKIIVGALIGSVSILSEAIHSGVDLIAAIIALFSVRTSGIPPDKRHPFGHGKIENISGTIEALLIFAAACWIIFEAIMRLRHPEPLEALGWGVGVMLISAVANYFVSQRLFKVGKETDSVALAADAWHLRTDVYTSAGVMIGLALIWLGERIYPGIDLDWLDPAAAIAVALLIIKAAYDLTIQSAKDLLDVTLPPEEESWIRQRILQHQPVIHGFHRLRTRKSGHFRFVEFHLKVDPDMSVQISHAITEDLSLSIEKQFPGTSVMIHIEPCDGDCEGDCLQGCLLPEQERQEQQQRLNP